VFFHTSEHDRGHPQRSVSTTVSFPEATDDTLALAAAATEAVNRVWRDGYRYSKSGVMTTDLVPLAASQRALIGGFDRERSGRLMAALDACNARFGRGTVVPASAGIVDRRKWATKFEMRSPRYTTRLEETPVVRAA
jgi:DNA polymerase V